MAKVLLGLTAVMLALGAQAEAQERAGVVTTLEGDVTVTRASLSQPAPLKFKDDIFVKDRIATGTSSVARILLGGRAVVTVREHSVVTITEVPGVSTVDVVAGRAAVAVAREKMRPGDLVEVKTPNAVAGIRGTVIVAEVFDADHSAITVLKGVIDVKRIDGGHRVGNPTVVTALQRVTIEDRAPVSSPQPIAPDAATRLGQEFRLAPPRSTPSAATTAVNQAEADRTARYLAAIAPRATDRGTLLGVMSENVKDGGGDADKMNRIDKAESAKASRGRGPEATVDGVIGSVSGAKSGARPAASAVGDIVKPGKILKRDR